MSIGQVYSLIKTHDGKWVPGDRDAKDKTDKFGAGEFAMVTLRKPRNIKFHRKAFALFQLAYSMWNPAERSIAGMPARKSFDVFRRELVIAAGYYEIALGLDGEPRLEAKSLRFDACDDLEFSEIYESVVAVLMSGIMKGIQREELDRIANEVEKGGF